MAKKEYTGMIMTRVGVELQNRILAGSKTSKPIKVQNVTVEDFAPGFGAETPADPSDDFQTIDFD